MKRISIILLLVPGLLVGSVLEAKAQKKFEGIATYQSSMSMESLNVAGQDMSPEMQASLRKQLAQQMQREYTLSFNVQEAVWKQNVELDPVTNSSSNGGVQIRMANGNTKSYINPGKNEFLEEADIFGKKFLIQDELEQFKWKITGETKKIGDYTVTKAEFMDISETTSISMNGDEQTTHTTQDTTLITAWFTPEIPVSQGPNNAWGLPGLILELKDGNLSFLCTQLVLNPETPVAIEKPSKGKRVTRDEARTIREEKLQEMMKKYDTGEGENTRVIRIGG